MKKMLENYLHVMPKTEWLYYETLEDLNLLMEVSQQIFSVDF